MQQSAKHKIKIETGSAENNHNPDNDGKLCNADNEPGLQALRDRGWVEEKICLLLSICLGNFQFCG